MWLQFIGQNVHFAVNIFAALVCLGVGWLYLDAWSNQHSLKELCKWLGFGVLGLSFFCQAITIEQSVLGASFLGHWLIALMVLFRLAGYVLIIVGQILDPLQMVPKNDGLKLDPTSYQRSGNKGAASGFGLAGAGSTFTKWLMPFLGFVIASLYWRRATTGLERHQRPVALAFVGFGLADLLALATFLRNTPNPQLYIWVSAFGWVWWLGILVLAVGTILLGRWVWGYLVVRFMSQLFMIFTSMVLAVFLVVSVCFTGLLLHNVQGDVLANLRTAARVLNYALTSKQQQTTAAAEQLADNSDVRNAILRGDRELLGKMTKTMLADKKLSGLMITSESGQVLLRAEDTAAWGDSVSGDNLVRRALLGLGQSSVSSRDGVTVPKLQVRSAAVVKDAAGEVVGSVVATLDLDNAFVDGIQHDTGLQSSLYARSTLVATSVAAADGKTRPVGTLLGNEAIRSTVLSQGNDYQGSIRLHSQQVLAAISPIKDVDGSPIGMLVIAEPQSNTLRIAGRSIEATFLMATVLLILGFVPSYKVSKSIARQLK